MNYCRSIRSDIGVSAKPFRVALIPFTGLDPDNVGSRFGAKIARQATELLNSSPTLDLFIHDSSNNTCLRYLSLDEILNVTGLDYIIDGTIRISPTHYIIDVDFTDCSTGGLIWSDRFRHCRNDLDTDGLVEQIITQLMTTFNFLFIAQMPGRVHA